MGQRGRLARPATTVLRVLLEQPAQRVPTARLGRRVPRALEKQVQRVQRAAMDRLVRPERGRLVQPVPPAAMAQLAGHGTHWANWCRNLKPGSRCCCPRDRLLHIQVGRPNDCWYCADLRGRCPRPRHPVHGFRHDDRQEPSEPLAPMARGSTRSCAPPTTRPPSISRSTSTMARPTTTSVWSTLAIGSGYTTVARVEAMNTLSPKLGYLVIPLGTH